MRSKQPMRCESKQQQLLSLQATTYTLVVWANMVKCVARVAYDNEGLSGWCREHGLGRGES